MPCVMGSCSRMLCLIRLCALLLPATVATPSPADEIQRVKLIYPQIAEDEGVGFDLATSNQGGGGTGLISMRERVLAQGGTLEVFSATDTGTSIRVRIPVKF